MTNTSQITIQSPGVEISEINSVNHNINVMGDIAIFVGEFEKGPINEPKYITDVLQFKLTFGRATEDNYNQWYQVFNFLMYSKGIWVCRTSGDNFEYSNNNNIIAKTPGEWGNLLSVEIFNSSDYNDNLTLKTYFNKEDIKKSHLVIIKRKDLIVETFSLDNANDIDSVYLKDIKLEAGVYKLSGGWVSPASVLHYQESYNLFTKEDYEIDIIIADEDYNELAIDLAENRGDCVAYIGLPRRFIDGVQINGSKLITEDGHILYISIKELKHILSDSDFVLINTYISELRKSTYAFFTIGFAVIVDGFTSKKKIINLIGDVAGLKAKQSTINKWTPSVGLERGKVAHDEVSLIIKKDMADILYREGVNVFQSNVLMSQKLFINRPSIINRVHSRSILNYIKRNVEKQIAKYIFALHDRGIRAQIAINIKLLLEEIISYGGLERAKVHVTSGNEPDTIIINIIIKISSVAEVIKVNMYNTGTKLITDVIGG